MKYVLIALIALLFSAPASADPTCHVSKSTARWTCGPKFIWVGMCDCYWRCVHYDNGRCVISEYVCPRCPWRD